MYKRTTSIVISFHLLFLMLLLFSTHHAPVKKTTHVRVRTVKPIVQREPVKKAAVVKAPPKTSSSATAKAQKPTSPKPHSAAVAKAQKPTSPKPHSAAATKPIAKKPSTPHKPAAVEKDKPVQKKEIAKETNTEIWSEIDQALAKIEKKSYPTSKQSLHLPEPVAFLEESRLEDGDDVMSQMIGFLHDTLHLPEVGEVKVEITVRKDGKITQVVVLASENQKNKLYLQEHLPRVQLPMQFDQDKTWIVTFCNEI
jgi:outer membrane biosynthesis protein TonB